ncbi:MAG: CotH kinase family protein [Deltaproteobacteria bacterium]|nr:CotH kinase family protein [Deltaproteobacteria bacterium]
MSRHPIISASLLLALAACGDDAPSRDRTDTSSTDTSSTDVPSTDTSSTDVPSADVPSADVPSTDTVTPAPSTWEERFDHVLPIDHVVALTLDFAPGDWTALLLDWQTKHEKVVYPAAFGFDDEALAKVGVRLKGLNSLNVPESGPIDPTARYPLKIDFNRLGGPRFHEVDELALNTSGNDASRMRERLTASLYEALDVAAPRIAWADVTIDGAHVGLYVLAQVIDKRFLKERFGEDEHADDGNLYKCVYNDFGACALGWLGPDPASYVRATGCAPGYDRCGLVLQTNEDDPTLNDYADLVTFLDVLNNTPDETFASALAEVFDVDHFLRLAAVAYATSNFDSYFGKGHNFYLYRRADGRFQMIPWDFDLAYGNTECPGDPTDPTCGGADGHPLTRRIMAVPAWRAAYLAHLRALLDDAFTVERHASWVADMDALIGEAVARDPNAPLEGTYAEQIDPSGEGQGNLFGFVAARRAFIERTLPAE